MRRDSKGMGIYIHIPFCASKCDYCDFLSFDGTENDLQEQYVQALLKEIRAVCIKPEVDTVYIGGGTPTALPSPLLCKILQEVQNFNLANNAEITIEMNPCTNVDSLLPELKAHGVNRLSIGLQAWQDDLLGRIKRHHTAGDFIKTIQSARSAGINNINVDLMFGLPGQTFDHWLECLAQVISHSPEHISAYSLTPAENTPLWDALETGDVCLPREEEDRAMYHEAIRLLAAAGYEHYELSNFAKPGHKSRHNVNCWLRRPYFGFGLGAHSFDGAARWNNTSNMEQYLDLCLAVSNKNENFSKKRIEGLAINYELLTTQEAMAETMFLGLRMTKGISPQDFQANSGKSLIECYGSVLESFISKGLLEYKDENIALTPLGLDLANQVFESFL